MKTTTFNTEVLNHAITGMSNVSEGIYGCDLHNELFNMDYFIIGYYQAEQFLKGTSEGVFGAIQLVKEYEQDNFGECNTDLSSSEKVANMYAYIKGEEILQESNTLCDRWNDHLDAEDLAAITEELKELL